MRFEDTLKSWADDRGFGFIESDQGGAEVFFHIKTIVNLQGRPQVGQCCSFEVELGPQCDLASSCFGAAMAPPAWLNR